MRLTAKLLELDHLYIDKEVGDIYNKNEVLQDHNIKIIDNGITYINHKQLSASGLIFEDIQMSFNKPVTDLFQIEGESIIMEFIFTSAVDSSIEHLEWIKLYETNTHNLIYASNYKGRFKINPNIPISFITIILSKDFYFKLIPQNLTLHTAFSSHILNGNTNTLYPNYLPYNPYIHAVIQEIRNCKHTGELQRLYIETKIQELLVLQLEIYQQQDSLKQQVGLSKYDFEKIQEVKKILDHDFNSASSHSELSKRVSLNEFKLKKGFKAYYGVTIKSYVISLRMKKAIMLLERKEYNIGEIAYLCGYNGLVQFSTAFKTFYGYSPKNIQNGMDQKN